MDVDPETRKKSRSVFSQMQKSLLAAKDDVTKAKTKDTVRFPPTLHCVCADWRHLQVKKRIEIDTRIMGKITRDQTVVRKQEEARRDRSTANRREDDLIIKDSVVSLSCESRLTGTDIVS